MLLLHCALALAPLGRQPLPKARLASADDICIAVPLNYGKWPTFGSDEAHAVGTYFVGVSNDSQTERAVAQAGRAKIFVDKAEGHVQDALISLQRAANYCKLSGRRLMFIYEMDVKFTRFSNALPRDRNLTQEIIGSLVDIVNQHKRPFWMLGSFYMGSLTIPDPMHLNGNAIYDLSSRCFRIAMRYLAMRWNSADGYDVLLMRFMKVCPPICKTMYESTPRICNYWRGNYTINPSCWFVHN